MDYAPPLPSYLQYQQQQSYTQAPQQQQVYSQQPQAPLFLPRSEFPLVHQNQPVALPIFLQNLAPQLSSIAEKEKLEELIEMIKKMSTEMTHLKN